MKLEEVVGLRIKSAREAASLSQEALGVLVGIEEATTKVRIHQYEHSKHSPPFSMLARIATALNLPLTWFVCEEGTQEMMLELHKLPKSDSAEIMKSIMLLLTRKL